MNGMEKKSKKDYSLKWIFSYLEPHKHWFLINIIGSLSSVVVNILVIYLLSNATDTGLNNKYSSFIKDLYFLLGLTAIGAILIYVNRYSQSRYSVYSIRDMRNKVVDNLQRTSVSYMESVNTGDVITTLNNDINIVDKTLSKASDFICQPVILVSAILYLYTISWKLLIAVSVSIPIAMYINTRASKNLSSITKLQEDYTAEANSVFYDSVNIGGVNTSKAYNLEDWLLFRYVNYLRKALKQSLKLNRFNNIYLLYIQLAQVVVPIFVCSLYGGYLAVNGEITTGELIACQTLVVYLYSPSRQILRLVNSLKSTSGAIQRICKLLDTPKDEFGVEDVTPNNICIEFENVSFNYETQSNTLAQINFKIEEGTKVALVGESGSGKSTIFKLICGFYKNQSGNIRFYGKDINLLDIKKIRQNISIVSQDVYIFPSSIYSNIKNGSKTATKEEVIAAAKLANIHEYICSLPEGYDTVIGENGVSLSGGQKQRLSIARAILKNAPVLLLDEATSALDNKNQAEIQSNIDCIFKDKTILTIAHRLNTIIDADDILVLDKGSIKERGTHEALMNKSQYYMNLYNRQFSA